ncbi:tripartite tricarboxylate transporter substrate binding protein [Piscinibacter koreensis]|uniref:Tripartite tricarboxylate transporter substrate binding protein n=1 Tax=Piscinibacter koreensis TaxID=2742824 RepID=A0A7Y6TX09_9BURK|nr:tripartite tricarboxylate transporter substrate binding protein [Schlegelella koreensis]NUZ06602.1 tripartite tricarboxylate transporter substrate binding protein [Schlegelella koreensis]
MSTFLLRRAFAAAALVTLAAAPLAAAHAAPAWKPERTVTLVVPYAPGGGTDAQARALAVELQRIWGQTVIVDNTAGADGLIGTHKVIDAKPDGLTLLVQLPSMTLIKHTPTFRGVDPLARLVPISAFSTLPGVVVANAALPVRSMADVMRYCKTAAPPCSLGTTENTARMQARTLATEGGLPNLIVANYKGGGQLITDLVGNNVKLGIMGVTAVLPHHKAGTLRVVLTQGPRRSSVLPEVPSAVEAGLPAFDSLTWYGLFAPKDTPPGVVQAVADAVREAVKADALRKSFATIGAEPLGNTPAEFAAMVHADEARFGALAKKFPLE